MTVLAQLPPLDLVPVEGAPARHPALVYLARLSDGSRRSMRGALDRLASLLSIGLDAETVPWASLRYAHTQVLRARLVAEGLAPATIARHLAALRGVLREAWKLGQLTTEEFTRAIDVHPPRGSRLARGRAVPAREIEGLFSACDVTSPAGLRDRALLALLYGGGLRRAEAAALALGDVEGDAGAVRVRGKGDRERRVPLPGGARRALLAWIEARGAAPGPLLRAVRGRRVLDGGMGAQAVFESLERLAKKAGVRHLSPHDLRRTYVGDLLDAGADIATVQRLAGHALVTTTARYDRRGDVAAERTADLLRVPV